MPFQIGTTIAAAPVDVTVTPQSILPDFNLYGTTPDIDTGSTPQDIWPAGGLYPFPAGAAVTDIVSTSALDTAGGTGARTVVVTGLDGAFNILIQVVTMTGTVPVVLAGAYRRINRVEVVTAGAGENNAGTITVRHPGPTVISQMDADVGKALAAVMTVPEELRNPRITSAQFSMIKQATSAATCVIQVRQNFDLLGVPIVDPGWTTEFVVGLHTQGTTAFQLITSPGTGLRLRPGVDIRFRVTLVTASNNAMAAGLTLVYDPPLVIF